MPNLARNQCVLIFSHLPQSSEGESFDAFNLGTIESTGTPELQECDTFTSSALSTDTYKSHYCLFNTLPSRISTNGYMLG